MLPHQSTTELWDLLLNYDSPMNNIKFIKNKAQSVLRSLFRKLLQHCLGRRKNTISRLSPHCGSQWCAMSAFGGEFWSKRCQGKWIAAITRLFNGSRMTSLPNNTIWSSFKFRKLLEDSKQRNEKHLNILEKLRTSHSLGKTWKKNLYIIASLFFQVKKI